MPLFRGTIAIAACALITLSGLAAQQAAGANLEVLQLRPNFYMIAGAGGNIGFQVGVDGVVVVDSGSAARTGDAIVGSDGRSVRTRGAICSISIQRCSQFAEAATLAAPASGG